MKKLIPILVAGFIIIGIFGFASVKSLFQSEPEEDQGQEEIPIEQMKKLPDDAVEAEVKLNFDKTRAIVKVAKLPSNMKRVDFDLLYTADLKDADNMPRGSNGVVTAPATDGFLREVVLGTCSKGRCVYEKNPKDFKLIIKTTSQDGEKAYWQKEFPEI